VLVFSGHVAPGVAHGMCRDWWSPFSRSIDQSEGDAGVTFATLFQQAFESAILCAKRTVRVGRASDDEWVRVWTSGSRVHCSI
jgi:hypothetical protein